MEQRPHVLAGSTNVVRTPHRMNSPWKRFQLSDSHSNLWPYSSFILLTKEFVNSKAHHSHKERKPDELKKTALNSSQPASATLLLQTLLLHKVMRARRLSFLEWKPNGLNRLLLNANAPTYTNPLSIRISPNGSNLTTSPGRRGCLSQRKLELSNK